MRLLDPIFDTSVRLIISSTTLEEPIPESWEDAYFFVSGSRVIVDQNNRFTSGAFPANNVVVNQLYEQTERGHALDIERWIILKERFEPRGIEPLTS